MFVNKKIIFFLFFLRVAFFAYTGVLPGSLPVLQACPSIGLLLEYMPCHWKKH